ncbi:MULTISPECIES: type II toxin-antitoxin system VapC family toxin [unclassified Endozoicomonas]|uniref:type II toxin-antitoxin system VapC family toxin n=1 Tax=unclassified Endozoicomonas TaxID=2644528 RepID=UPI003BB7DD6F
MKIINKLALVDTCILIDILDSQSIYFNWSCDTLNQCRHEGSVLYYNLAILAELSTNFVNLADLIDFFDYNNIKKMELTEQIMFDAGVAFRKCKGNGGKKHTVLADFVIGATAKNNDMVLITRDKGNFKTYFPEVPLLQPSVGNPL